ncbi:MAG: hypothetical protein ACFHXK_06485 [bacterium]
MAAFRMLLVVMLIVLGVYTAVVIFEYGMILFEVFFGDMAALNWAGQFNLDFMFMLMLSALWVSWRHGFSPAGLGLGVLAFFGGAAFLTIYLLVMSASVDGDVRRLLLGDRLTENSV